MAQSSAPRRGGNYRSHGQYATTTPSKRGGASGRRSFGNQQGNTNLIRTSGGENNGRQYRGNYSSGQQRQIPSSRRDVVPRSQSRGGGGRRGGGGGRTGRQQSRWEHPVDKEMLMAQVGLPTYTHPSLYRTFNTNEWRFDFDGPSGALYNVLLAILDPSVYNVKQAPRKDIAIGPRLEIDQYGREIPRGQIPRCRPIYIGKPRYAPNGSHGDANEDYDEDEEYYEEEEEEGEEYDEEYGEDDDGDDAEGGINGESTSYGAVERRRPGGGNESDEVQKAARANAEKAMLRQRAMLLAEYKALVKLCTKCGIPREYYVPNPETLEPAELHQEIANLKKEKARFVWVSQTKDGWKSLITGVGIVNHIFGNIVPLESEEGANDFFPALEEKIEAFDEQFNEMYDDQVEEKGSPAAVRRNPMTTFMTSLLSTGCKRFARNRLGLDVGDGGIDAAQKIAMDAGMQPDVLTSAPPPSSSNAHRAKNNGVNANTTRVASPPQAGAGMASSSTYYEQPPPSTMPPDVHGGGHIPLGHSYGNMYPPAVSSDVASSSGTIYAPPNTSTLPSSSDSAYANPIPASSSGEATFTESDWDTVDEDAERTALSSVANIINF